jgi:hypothetical protein
MSMIVEVLEKIFERPKHWYQRATFKIIMMLLVLLGIGIAIGKFLL